MCPAKTPPISSKAQANNIEEDANTNTSPAYKPPELVSVPYNSYTYSLLTGVDSGTSTPRIVLDERTDVWMMGCVMYALAFGMSPFESLAEGVKKLGIMNARYTIPGGNLSPMPSRDQLRSTEDQFSPLTMPPPLPVKGSTKDDSTQYVRASCQTQFSAPYISIIRSMLQLNYLQRPYADDVMSRCDSLLREHGVEM